jgi:hypothetical protein
MNEMVLTATLATLQDVQRRRSDAPPVRFMAERDSNTQSRGFRQATAHAHTGTRGAEG